MHNPLTCQKKKAYQTKKEAKAIAKIVRKKALEAYLCDCCGFWHIGHKKWKEKAPEFRG
jgi:hypothetical protein